MSRGIAGKIKINSFADIVGGDGSIVTQVPVSDLHTFKDHPFRVVDDEKMQETVESIKKHGVLVPGIVRPRMEGGYEIIAGHRRKRACEIAEIPTMPVVIKNYTDDEAVVAMVDTNIQRDDILPSEKAKAYSMKYEAMKHQGSREGGHTHEILGEKAGESGKTVQRYILLSKLSDELLAMVDEKKVSILCGIDLAFLTEKEQEWVLRKIKENGISLSADQTGKLKEYSKRKELTFAMVELILSEEKPKKRKFTIKTDRLAEYFDESVTEDEIGKIIFQLLDKWKADGGK